MTARTLIRNARVLACTGDASERPFDGDILIEGARVELVTPGRLDPDAVSARVVDVRGATVLPGLGDAHTHISWPLDFVFDHAGVAASPPAEHAMDVAAVARTFLESGYTLIVSASVLQPQDDVVARDAIERGLIPGPRIVPGNLLVTSPGAISDGTPMSVVAADARELREIVARQCDAGARAIKLFISGDGIVPEFPSDDVYMNDEMLEAAVDEAARHDAFITVHARGSASVAMAARTGVRLIHHACFLDDEALRALEARRDDVWVCPGLHYLYAVVNGHAEPWGVTQEKIELSGYRDELKAQIEGLTRLRASGIRIVAGGDFGHQWTKHGTYAAELERYVELVGMTPAEAVHTATRDMGPLVGLETGQIRPGYLADLLVVDGDPTEDISVLRDPARRRLVFKDGQVAYVNPLVYP
ncbi:amidohydrolase family protein [Frankia sp. CNm7]|uniref:Amidohydrolase family protein n=1 Tax=Frankia nepalensis TaxID=1836974 RepID=A0A937RCX6_9ACTN|nr:amidohydrolase family protein [Frankia nepalensis]MBL7501715.1 amidohydrolase family protein [Frankia nepalensis]MBL7511573.1 amidohydrolase family protein [Frankia nepalensis]MBL7518583.1 amidohydrolase family protein [Frankia nepalensis]MBL7626599.1 amidohydrolase family protein [Frankia nepalensis]